MKKKLFVLHLEDNQNDVDIIHDTMEQAGIHAEFKVVQTRDEFIKALQYLEVDLVFCDFTLPSFDGKTALELSQKIKPDIPFIFVSGTMGEDRAVESLLLGATDYVLKERLSRLIPAVRRAIEQRKEKAESEKNLQELRKLSSAINQSADSVVITDRNGIIEFVNPAFEKNTGYSRAEAIGKTPRILKSGHHSAELFVELWRAILAGETFHTEFVNKRKNGDIYYQEETITPIIDKNGRVTHFVSTGRDVTERKSAEESLIDRERQLEALLSSLDDIVFEFDEKGTYLNVWAADEALLVRPRSELLGRTITEILGEAGKPFTDSISRVIETGKTENVEYDLDTQGGRRWFVARVSRVLSPEQKRKTASMLIRDITDRVKTQEELRRSEEQYRSLVDGARDAIFRLSPEGIITSLNPAFEAISGWKREEWLGKTFSQLFHPDDHPRARAIFGQVIRGTKFPPQEYRVVTKSGAYIVGEFVTTPQISEGKVSGVLGIARDITERKKLEEQLRQAQKLESIGTLAGGIAHDFNNILGVIMAYGSLIQRGKPQPKELAEYTDTMLKAAERGAGLVKQILTFARKTEVSVESVQANYVIKELLTMLHQTFPKTIGFSVDLHKSLPLISVDAGQLNQALMNLCVNARDAILEANKTRSTPNSTISIKTSTVSGESLKLHFSAASSEEYVSIGVSDTGTGIDENTRQRIFEPFFTTKGEGKGTGLGLSVVYGIVRAHQGFIDFKSTIGEGTSFVLYFPVLKDAFSQTAATKREVREISGGSETVLVVEDEDVLRILLKGVLEAKGYKVLTAIDGFEAISVFEKNKDAIAIVVSDHGLPGINGADAAKKMMEMKKGLKCIIASGYAEPNEKSEMLKAGVKEFVQKPYDPMELVRKVREVLDTK